VCLKTATITLTDTPDPHIHHIRERTRAFQVVQRQWPVFGDADEVARFSLLRVVLGLDPSTPALDDSPTRRGNDSDAGGPAHNHGALTATASSVHTCHGEAPQCRSRSLVRRLEESQQTRILCHDDVAAVHACFLSVSFFGAHLAIFIHLHNEAHVHAAHKEARSNRGQLHRARATKSCVCAAVTAWPTISPIQLHVVVTLIHIRVPCADLRACYKSTPHRSPPAHCNMITNSSRYRFFTS
jgi:hypothetical protein